MSCCLRHDDIIKRCHWSRRLCSIFYVCNSHTKRGRMIAATGIYDNVNKYTPIKTFNFIRCNSRVYREFIQAPLLLMYIYGWWCGLEVEDICSNLTKTPSSLWLKNQDDCLRLIEQRVDSVALSAALICYIYTMYKSIVIIRYCIMKSMTALYRRLCAINVV